MAVEKAYRTDAEAILSHRWDNGGDLWATPDKRLLKGAPFFRAGKSAVPAGAGNGAR